MSVNKLRVAAQATGVVPGEDKPRGLCWCGCGGKTKIGRETRSNQSEYKGVPHRYIMGHQMRARTGEKNSYWRGGRRLNCEGYIMAWQPNHPRAGPNGYVAEHILIAERVLGRFIPRSVEIHHVNGNRSDNRTANLVICQDLAYHLLLHRRQRALDACGHADWRHCRFCKRYDDPAGMYVHPKGTHAYHRACKLAYSVARYGR